MKPLLILALASVAFQASASDTVKVPAPIVRFLKRHPEVPRLLVESKEKKIQEGYALRLTMNETEFQFHRFGAGVDDAYSYEICYRSKSDQYWVVREGGFDNVFEVFGPFKMD